jgi:hypothetical protein
VRSIDFEPLLTFRMRGIGYGHPVHSHGTAHGALAVAGDTIVCADVNPIDPTMLHVQTLCRVRATEGDWSADGMGILEQFVVGDHVPSGLTGTVDGFPG